MTSNIQRFLLEDLDIRGALVKLDDVWQSLQTRRDYPPAVAGLLGEMVAVSVVIAGNLKQQGRLTLQIHGSGPVGLLVVDCAEGLNLRAMARVDQIDAAARAHGLVDLVGNGRLQLSLETDTMREPYASMVPLESASVAETFEHYLAQSEQQPSTLILACDESVSAALFLQKLPGADERDPDGWNRADTLARTTTKAELLSLPADELLGRIFGEETLRLFDARPVIHHCPPDRDKIVTMLRGLGEPQVREILAEHGEVAVHDDLSNHSYVFDANDVEALFAGTDAHTGKGAPPRTVH